MTTKITTAPTITPGADPALVAALEAFDDAVGRKDVGLPHPPMRDVVDAVTAAAIAAGVWTELIGDWTARTDRHLGLGFGNLTEDAHTDARDRLAVAIDHARANAASDRLQAAQEAVTRQQAAVARAERAGQFDALPGLRRELELELRHELEEAQADVLAWRADVADALLVVRDGRRDQGAVVAETFEVRRRELEEALALVKKERAAHAVPLRLMGNRLNDRLRAAERLRAEAKAAEAALPTVAQRTAAYASRVG